MSPGIALLIGICLSAFNLNPSKKLTHQISKRAMAWSIVGLGSTVKIGAVYAVSVSSFQLTVLTLLVTIGGGWIIGNVFGITSGLRALIASGTAICGATAIATIGETLNSKREEMSLALGVVLILNGIALLLFPYLGHLIGLTPHEFGVWAGLAIHDTSSVVGAALQYSHDSVEVATTVKLARAVWIAPLAVMFAYLLHPPGSKLKIKLPWFIAGFVVAAALFSFLHFMDPYAETIGFIARKGFIIAILLLGANIDLSSLRQLGLRPLFYGITLWILSSIVSLLGVI